MGNFFFYLLKDFSQFLTQNIFCNKCQKSFFKNILPYIADIFWALYHVPQWNVVILPSQRLPFGDETLAWSGDTSDRALRRHAVWPSRRLTEETRICQTNFVRKCDIFFSPKYIFGILSL